MSAAPERVVTPCRRCGGLRRVSYDQLPEGHRKHAPFGSVFPCPDCGDDTEVVLPIAAVTPSVTHIAYRYRWDRQGRKGQLCYVLARGKMNSCLVEFADGFQMVTSRNAVARFHASEEVA